MNRDGGLAIAGVILTVVFGVPAWWALFIEHPETLPAVTWALRLAFPVLTFLLGVFTGWHLRKLASGGRARRDDASPRKAAAAGGATREPLSSQGGEDPLAELVPAEVPFLLSVYNGAQAHVGMENLMVARSLRRKGVVYRTDAPESDVISQCDVALTDDWVRIMNERADELR